MDQRSPVEKRLWSLVGPPLYYCADCLRAVTVEAVEGAEPKVTRPCGPDCGAEIIAPRKAIAVGQGGMNTLTRVKLSYMQFAAALTGRCV